MKREEHQVPQVLQQLQGDTSASLSRRTVAEIGTWWQLFATEMHKVLGTKVSILGLLGYIPYHYTTFTLA